MPQTHIVELARADNLRGHRWARRVVAAIHVLHATAYVAGLYVSAVTGFLLLILMLLIPLILISIALSLTQYWVYRYIYALCTPARISAVWLRRFDSEKSESYRPSQDIDRLAEFGIAVITLRDRMFSSSSEKRRSVMAPTFFLLSIVAIPLCLMLSNDFIEALALNQIETDVTNIIEALFIGSVYYATYLFFLGVAVFVAVIVSVVLTYAIVAVFGGFIRSGDDIRRLKKLETDIPARRLKRGAAVLRIDDDKWRHAVQTTVALADSVIIDASDVTENISWEIRQVLNHHSASAIVFLARQGSDQLQPNAESPGRFKIDLSHIDQRLKDIRPVIYPHTSEYPFGISSDPRFREALRDAVYTSTAMKLGEPLTADGGQIA